MTSSVETRLFIDGAFVEAEAKQTFDVIDPTSEEVVASVSKAAAEDLDRAVAAARRAFDDGNWSGMLPFDRGRILDAVADRIESRLEAIAEIETRSGGKTLANSRNEVQSAARVFRYYAGAMDKFFGETIPMGSGVLDFTLREPVGVVGQITPWNFPFLAAAWKVAPALAAGCTVVLKPASATPLTSIMLAEAAHEAGVPPGVLNVLPGPGRGLGDRMATHSGIDKIAFTGATQTGTELIRQAASDIKRVSLELGGKSPNIVFADADLEQAAQNAVPAVFGNAGQSCSARTRLFVQRQSLDEFMPKLMDAVAAFRVGDPMDSETDMGPLVSKGQWLSVKRHVDQAVEDGATLACGGDWPDDRADSAYFAPTVFTGVTNDMAIAQEEVFGPVLAVIAFDDEYDAIAMANDSPYGLNASVWSRDIKKALRVARRLRSGMVSINSHGSASRYGLFAPFGGYKQSGHGRELGMSALSLYTEVKNVFVDLTD